MTHRIHPDASTDEAGNPVHPENPDRYICGRGKSEQTTSTDHGRERDDVDYCMLTAGHGTKDPKRTGEPGVACTHHGGDSPRGEENGNFKTGAFSEYFTSHLTDTEQTAFDEARQALEDPESAQEIARHAATICLVKFRRSGDERFLRRFESICDKFAIAPEDELTVHHEGLEDAFMSNLREYHEDS